ncbi:SCO family protein [Roseateles cellulosilyticus]|nr:SCO family protein [Pelomonas sp. P8]
MATTRPGPQRLVGTVLACAAVLTLFVATVERLTDGFEHWTFEALRRQQAASGQLRWPAMAVIDAMGRPLQWPAGGPVRIVDFIYTNCESVCQSLGAEFFQAQQLIRREAPGVRLMSVSIDPARDTPPALAGYAARHRAQAPLWTVAAPRSVDDGLRVRRALGVIAVPDGLGGFVHNGALHVVDRQGHVAGIFDTADWPSAVALAARLDAGRP